ANDETPSAGLKRRRLTGWACAGVVVLLLLGVCFSASLAGAAYWMVHRDNDSAATATITVKAPQPIAGPALDMALPAGSTLTTQQVDENGGNWWFANADPNPIRVLIATSKLMQQSALSDDYFQHVVNVVEQAAGDQVVSIDTPQAEHVGNYSGERA